MSVAMNSEAPRRVISHHHETTRGPVFSRSSGHLIASFSRSSGHPRDDPQRATVALQKEEHRWPTGRMWEVLEVLRRVARGERRRSIARATGHGRTTVDRCAKTALELGWVPGNQPPDETLAREVAQQLRPGPKQRPSGSAEAAHSGQSDHLFRPIVIGRFGHCDRSEATRARV